VKRNNIIIDIVEKLFNEFGEKYLRVL
jgi:hypothetical protein